MIQKRDEDGELEAFYIDSLKFHLNFADYPDELKKCKAMGIRDYLEYKIPLVIKAKKAKGEKIGDNSTMATMTQGMTELSGPSYYYDIYFVKKFEDIKPANVDGNAIFIVGEKRKRKAYLISNEEFYKVNGKKLCHEFTLTREQERDLQDIKFDASNRAEVTETNHAVLKHLKKTTAKAAGWIYLGSNSNPLDIFVADHEQRPCHFFMRTFPYLTRFTMFCGMTLSTIVSFSLVDAIPNPIFPPSVDVFTNSTTGNSTVVMTPNPYLRPFNITQTLLGWGMSIAFIFLGQRARTLRGLGMQIDDFFIKLYRKLCGAKTKVPQKPKEPAKKWTCLDVKMTLAKITLSILVLNQVALSILWSYLRITTISDTVAQNQDSLFPPEAIKDISITQWALDQLSEPPLIFAEFAFVIYLVEFLFKPTNLLKSLSEQVMGKKPAEDKKEDDAQDQLRRPLLAEVKEHQIEIVGGTQSSSALYSPKNPRNIKAGAADGQNAIVPTKNFRNAS